MLSFFAIMAAFCMFASVGETSTFMRCAYLLAFCVSMGLAYLCWRGKQPREKKEKRDGSLAHQLIDFTDKKRRRG